MTVEDVLDRYGRDKIGMPDNSQFVMPKAQMDDLVARTGGDVGKLEQALGIPEGAWTNREMVQINIATPRDFNVRMPSGNEMGANNLWLPGGRLPTGQLEAVVDQIPKGGYTESLLPQAGKNLTPSNAPALNLAPAGHGMKPVTNPPAPATPVKAHTSANQANQGSHPVADPGASPTVKRAINALQEGSPDTRIGKTELQFREAVEGGAKGVGVASSAPARLLPGAPGVVTGGNSTALGRNLLESMGVNDASAWPGYQAQHIIPSQMRSHPVVQKVGMDFDNAQNGIFLRIPDMGVSPMARHQGFHSVYNKVVAQRLDAMNVNLPASQLEQQVFSLQQQLKGLQQSGLPLYGKHGATVDMWNRWLDK